MAWIYLVVAGLFEVVWAYQMKQSAGFTKFWPTVITAAAMLASVVLLSLSMRTLPLGSAYAIWTGIGALGAFVLGIVLLGEAAGPFRLLSAGLILAGLIGLRLAPSA
jgi:quaternary ammonium compound-resistance protein SugE